MVLYQKSRNTHEKTLQSLNTTSKGKEQQGTDFEQKTIPGEAIIVFGQDQDRFKGGYDDTQAFSGWIADFGISEKLLSAEEVKNISTCKALFGGDILTTGNVDNATAGWEVGKVDILDQEDIGEFCEVEKTVGLATIQGGMDYGEVNDTCSVMGGRLLTLTKALEMAGEVVETLWDNFGVN